MQEWMAQADPPKEASTFARMQEWMAQVDPPKEASTFARINGRL